MFYIDEMHKERFEDALRASGALKEDGKIEAYYGASLYLLTALTGAWARLARYVEPGCIDFPEMLDNVVLSSGEEIIVRLAGNFYNGGFWSEAGLTPWDIVSSLDGDCLNIVACAFRLRAARLTADTLFAA
ncbi:hypothetical protein [Clostridium sp. D33t1_170424_F3]|uniref:hypothetical protein n=1 Tax=Clostridium sp. D33t1_170424_F3 TaxID=2787099 RepID=UPI0018AB20BC|nr:hypothetical protein [Clostridium sp. D33t1_170424_F3]